MYDEELKEKLNPDNFIYDNTRKQETIPFVSFRDGNGEEVGHLDWEIDGQFTFSGNMDESVNIFFKFLQQFIDDYIEENR